MVRRSVHIAAALVCAVSAASASPVVYCTNDSGVGYFGVQQMRDGLIRYDVGPLEPDWSAMLVVNCAEDAAVYVRPTEESPDWQFMNVTFYMRLAEGPFSVDDYASYYDGRDYLVTAGAVPADGCACQVRVP